MAYPDIHTCMRLTAENEELKMKLVKVKHQRDEAVGELRQIRESNKVNELLRNYVTTRDIHVQTEPRGMSYPSLGRPAKKKEEDENVDSKKSSTLLSMHNNLMRRYEKEVKQNMTHIETITNLNIQAKSRARFKPGVSLYYLVYQLGQMDLEKKLKERTEEITKLEHDLKPLQIQAKSRARFKPGVSLYYLVYQLGQMDLERKLNERTEEITKLEHDLKLLQIQAKSRARFKPGVSLYYLVYQLGQMDLERKLKERTEEITKLEHDLKLLQIQAKSRARFKPGVSLYYLVYQLGQMDLERKLKERTEEITKLEHDIKLLQIQAKSRARFKPAKHRSRAPEDSSEEDEEEEDVSKVRKENKRLHKQITKFKLELEGLDQGFFEEIEDIKFALLQSAKLNKIYEKTLRKTCMQFGAPYPHPERQLEDQRQQS